MPRIVLLGVSVAAFAALSGCGPALSPNTYAVSAVQQANKVEPGVVAGFRQVSISSDGTVGAVAGGAAGGILGAELGPGGINAALGAVGGTTIGSLLGTTIERISGDTTGWEYIVRKPDGGLLSVTQREPTPIPIGQRVLVITGSQARVVPDYSVTPEEPRPDAPKPGVAEPAGSAPIPLRPTATDLPPPEPAPPVTPAGPADPAAPAPPPPSP